MGVTVNNVHGGIEIVIDTENKKMFPKEDTRVELFKNRVTIKDVSPEAGETVTLDVADVTSPSLGNNTLLYEAIRDMVYGAPLYKIINGSTGDNPVVTATTGKKIRVLAAFGLADIAGVIRWESGAGGTALTGEVNVGATGGYVLPLNPLGWFETAAGAALNLEVTTSTKFQGTIVYELI